MRLTQSKFLLPLLALLLLVGTGMASPKTPWLGIYMQNVNDELAEAFDLKVDEGVLINNVVDDSPADEAGLERGDVVLAWNGDKVTDADMLSDLVADSKVGDKVDLTILRDGDKQDVTVEIGEQDFPTYSFKQDLKNKYFHALENLDGTGIGVSVQPLTGDLGEYFGVPDGKGALITEVHEDSPAAKAGLKAGDVIVKVDDDVVESPSDVHELIAEHEKGDKVELTIMRDRNEQQLAVEVGDLDIYGLKNFKLPNLPQFYRFDRYHNVPYYSPFDDEHPPYRSEDLENQMSELQLKMEELQRKLNKLEEKMD